MARITVHALDHLVLNVRDVSTAADWYERVLGVRRESFDPGQGKPSRVSIGFGRQKINLRPVDTDPEIWFTGRCPTAGSDDLCFLTEASPEDVVAHLAALDVPVEDGPVAKTGARGTLRSVYCRDPDGNLIEISSYRPDA